MCFWNGFCDTVIYMKHQNLITTGIAIFALCISVIALVQSNREEGVRDIQSLSGEESLGGEDLPEVVSLDISTTLPTETASLDDLSYLATFSVSRQSVGVIGDGFALARVRHADHKSYYRFVFDVVDLQGNPTVRVPFISTEYLQGSNNIAVYLGGFRGDFSSLMPIRTENGAIRDSAYQSVGVGNVLGWYKDLFLGDSGLQYSIELTDKVPYTMQVLENPMRIVIDILK
ncbi:MAG: hypothetical protein ACI83D_000632 [Planctomycetota bacterium]|jgi:hypothetical protein